MNERNVAKGLRLLFSAAMIVMLAMSMVPARTAHGQNDIPVADLVVTLVSIPKHVKACEIFGVVYSVTNLGPDPADQLFHGAGIPDAFDIVGVIGAQDSLAVGETDTFEVVIQVTGFMPGENRAAWVRGRVISESLIDPDPENNRLESPIKIISKPRTTLCF
jgi:hypothetical protein